MAVEPIPFEKRFWQIRTKPPTRPRPGHTSAIWLAIAAVTSIGYRFHRTARSLLFATSSSKKTRCSLPQPNPCVNTVCGSIEITLIELNLFQTRIHLETKIPTLKSGLSSLWVMKSIKEKIESIQAIQQIILTTKTSLEIILHLNRWKNRLT